MAKGKWIGTRELGTEWAQWQQGLDTSYIDGASDPQQNFQVGVQGPAGGPDTRALRDPLSPVTVPITLSMCFLTEGHGESLVEAIIKAYRIRFYQHSLSVGCTTHLTPLVSGLPGCLCSSHCMWERDTHSPEVALERAAHLGLKWPPPLAPIPGSTQQRMLPPGEPQERSKSGVFNSTDPAAVSALAMVFGMSTGSRQQ